MSDSKKASATTLEDETALLVSTWVYSLTLGVCAMQLATYWNTRGKDHPILQTAVFGLFINETIWTVMRCVAAHREIFIAIPGSPEARGIPILQMISCYFANITLMVVNVFLIYRYYRLTKRWWAAVPLALLACVSLSFHFWANTVAVKAVKLLFAPTLDVPALIKASADSTLAGRIAAVAEFAIVAAVYILLIVELVSYTRRDLLSGKQILRRLIFMTMETGLITFALTAALAVLAFYRTGIFTMSILMGACARAYYHTMLFNLNMRSSATSVMRGSNPGLTHLTGTLRTRDGGDPTTGTQLQSVSVTYHTATRCDVHDDKSVPFAARVGHL